MSNPMTEVSVSVNGADTSATVEPRTLLAHYLRDDQGLTGTHIGCDTSNCGACTVLLNGDAVKSCTVLAVQADGKDVTTVEGLSGPFDGFSAVQEGFRQEHGLQCGYCTPGMIMAATALLAEGQVHGGVAQGIAQALYEGMAYNEDGQPLTGTLVDYLVPGAPDVPEYTSSRTTTPTPNNSMGAKGIGESGSVGAPPAVVNAAVDAVSHLGCRDIPMPVTPQKLFAILHGGAS